jgi:hypothetical protein
MIASSVYSRSSRSFPIGFIEKGIKLMTIFWLSFLTILLFAQGAFAGLVAEVSMLRGEATAKMPDQTVINLQVKNVIPNGATISTKEKSFVRLTFHDKSQINIGPKSEMLINDFEKGKVGLVSIIQGQIRAEVSKGPKEAEKSKLIIKTKSAAMGIRGTDFLVSFNPENKNTAIITFEGNVAFAKTDEQEMSINSVDELEEIVSDTDRAVAVTDGLYSGALPELEHATIPIQPSPTQLNQLKENDTFEEKQNDNNENKDNKNYQSPVPPGISVKAAMNDNSVVLDEQIKAMVSSEKIENDQVEEKNANQNNLVTGFVNETTGAVAPIAGGLVDLKTAIYVAPPPNALFDHNTGLYVLPPNMGTVDETGNYKAPAGVELTPAGEFILIPNAPVTNHVVPVLVSPKMIMPEEPTLVDTSKNQASRSIASESENKTSSASNDVLGNGFFIPGTYFIDNKPINNNGADNNITPVNPSAPVHIIITPP